MNFFHILVVTAEEEIYRGKVSKVIACSSSGELGIMAGHAPLLAILRPGVLRLDCRGEQRDEANTCLEVIVLGGYLEVQPNNVIVLADAVERAEDLNRAKAEKAVQRAKDNFALAKGGNIDLAMVALELALARYNLVCKNDGINLNRRS
ncbi:MAG: ATP synthase F1 subunit epsilon [Mariprofundus sp.]|nr:ATP synthase F1 subunit epsilon [Mariprofundus sp.]